MAGTIKLQERELEYRRTWKSEKFSTIEPAEIFWAEHYRWLESQGYLLRPRYHPDWIPTWKRTKKYINLCEDSYSLPPLRKHIMDATRMSDGDTVTLKRIVKYENSDEVGIAKFFSSEPLASDPKNHCVPLLDVLEVPEYEGMALLVMPILRPFNRPKIWTFGEAVEFFRQVFEGIQFMHRHHYAHRDCTGRNIMMDPRKLYPNGFHPLNIDYDYKRNRFARHWTRTERPPKYFLIDFGLSRFYDPKHGPPEDLPVRGIDRTAPEIQGDKYNECCNPFATDIYYVGNMIKMEFVEVRFGFDFMVPLITDMTQDEPSNRPSIDEVVARFDDIYRSLNFALLRSRIISRKEDQGATQVYNFLHFFRRMRYAFMRIPPIPRAVLKSLPSPEGKAVPI
ncbi:kinase-like domain-containing protein [Gautieria morchelliformis]|nr:kinase-like domain-containing protein [Gautieria morchelliformis]